MLEETPGDRPTPPNTVERLGDQQFALMSFALQEGARTLEHQQAELDRLRERTVSQLGFSAAVGTFIVGALLAAEPARSSEFYLLMSAATVAAAGTLYVAGRVLQPVDGWRIKVGASLIVEDYARDVSYEALHELAGFYDSARESNERALKTKRRQFKKATLAAGVTLIWLIASLWRLA